MTYTSGDYWMICDRCGFKYRRSQMKKEWNGLWVCEKDYEPRHPQDTLNRGKRDNQAVPVARPRPEDDFITPGVDDVQAEDL